MTEVTELKTSTLLDSCSRRSEEGSCRQVQHMQPGNGSDPQPPEILLWGRTKREVLTPCGYPTRQATAVEGGGLAMVTRLEGLGREWGSVTTDISPPASGPK